MTTVQCFSDNCDCNNVFDAGNSHPTVSFRPRGVLARSLYHKHRHDEYLSQFDKKQVSLHKLNFVGYLLFEVDPSKVFSVRGALKMLHN